MKDTHRYVIETANLDTALKEFCSEYGVNYDKFMNSNWNLHLKSRS